MKLETVSVKKYTWSTDNLLRRDTFDNAAGIDPVREFSNKNKAFRLLIVPIEEGIEPVKALLPTLTICKFLEFARLAGRELWHH